MARGVLILDEHLYQLEQPLAQKNFKVYRVTSGMQDDQIAKELAHRILVTNNAADFREAAAIHEFSIIDTRSTLKDPAVLAEQISRVWIEAELRSKQPFYARLNQDGTATVTSIED
jgi:hypothetical protein